MTIKANGLLCICVLLLGCQPRLLNLQLHGTAGMNHLAGFHGLPVLVRVYQLTDINGFMQYDFMHLWKNDHIFLKSVLVDKQELSIEPNAQTQIKLWQHPRARYLAVMGLFHTPEKQHWRIVRKLHQWQRFLPQFMHVQVIGNQLQWVQ